MEWKDYAHHEDFSIVLEENSPIEVYYNTSSYTNQLSAYLIFGDFTYL